MHVRYLLSGDKSALEISATLRTNQYEQLPLTHYCPTQSDDWHYLSTNVSKQVSDMLHQASSQSVSLLARHSDRTEMLSVELWVVDVILC